ncbi:hypothetical protein ACHQM5_002187 [Ranunculus cassubicifolius]
MATTTPLDEETTKKVIRQVEFYFSDSNLPRDGFLTKTINESDDGLVSLALICSFSRMRSHLGLDKDVKEDGIPEETLKAVAETLRPSGFLKLSEDGKKVGRSSELAKPEEVIEQLDSRTICASPFEHNVTQEGVESFFSKLGKVTSIRLPRHIADKRFFCGSALIEFSTEEEATNALKQNLTYAGATLELKPKKDFDAEREKKKVELENAPPATNNNNSNKEPAYPVGLIVSFKLTPKAVEKSTEENGDDKKISEEKEDTEDPIVEDDKSTADVTQDTEEEPAVEEKEEKKPLGKVLDKTDQNQVFREDLKAVFQKFGEIKYVDFSMGDDSGFIRFDQPEEALKARAATVLVEDGLPVKNFFVTLEALSGDAEKQYWDKLRNNKQEKYSRGNSGRGGRNFRGGKRGRDNGYGGRPNKHQKVAT